MYCLFCIMTALFGYSSFSTANSVQSEMNTILFVLIYLVFHL